MLAGSFSFLPVLNDRGAWCLVSDRSVAVYLRGDITKRKERLASRLFEAPQVDLILAECVKEDTSLEDALRALHDIPLLVCRGENPKHLVGIVTAFDLL